MAKSYKKRLEDALWDLIEQARRLNVRVHFEDPRTTYSDDCHGKFIAKDLIITVYKEIDETLKSRHVHTLAHELRHAFQYCTRMCPNYWLAQVNVYSTWDKRHLEMLENDADQFANEYLIKNKLPLPSGEGKI